MFKSQLFSDVAAALGFPDLADLPDGFATGPFGWTLEQAQGTTATYAAGTIIDFAGATGTGQTAGTAGRIGGVLNNMSAAANPNIVLRTRRVKVQVSGTVGLVTSTFLADLMGSLVIKHQPGQAGARYYPLVDAIGQIDRQISTTASTVTYITGPAPSWSLISGTDLEVDLSEDTFELNAQYAVALPASSTIRLDVWFDGVAIIRNQWGGRVSVGGGPNGSCSPATQRKLIDNLATTTRTVALNLKAPGP